MDDGHRDLVCEQPDQLAARIEAVVRERGLAPATRVRPGSP
jgi:hypothetical protein